MDLLEWLKDIQAKIKNSEPHENVYRLNLTSSVGGAIDMIVERITELETQLAASPTPDGVTWRCPDCQSVTIDPADVTALEAAHKAAQARIAELEQNKRDFDVLLSKAEKRIETLEADLSECSEHDKLCVARIAELEDESRVDDEFIGALQIAAKQQKEHIAKLVAQLQTARQWQPINAVTQGCACDEECTAFYRVEDGGVRLIVGNDTDGELSVDLPEDVRLCKLVQP